MTAKKNMAAALFAIPTLRMKPAMGLCKASGSISMRMPRGGRPLVMARIMPAWCSSRATAFAVSVSTLSRGDERAIHVRQ
jgi:hypothetical protein